MKKRITSLLLVLAMCFVMLPTAAFAADEQETQGTQETQGAQEPQGSESNAEPTEEPTEEPNDGPIRISITTIDELTQFAADVNDGKYDGKTDAVVSLDADLDLKDVEWTSIGDGDHYFSGTFYGNGHTISNLDFSSLYGKVQYASDGFFGYMEKATVADLTVEGTINVESAKEYVAFGAIVGETDGCTISNCVADVSFNNNGYYVYGMLGLCGYAANTTIEYCENKGNMTVTGDMGSLYMGGIAGYADNTTIQYCNNVADMIFGGSHNGSIAGELARESVVKNCYSIGQMKALGKGSEDTGGLVGLTYGSTTIVNCYNASEMNLSEYTGKLPYVRLGGIVGKIDNDSPNFTNNYYAETTNVYACGNDTGVRDGVSTKSADYMKTEDFYKEITEAGGAYRYEEGSTPLFPKLTHEVSFVITPENMTDIVITVDGQEAANPIALENGKHTFTVTAKNCDPFSGEFTVSANPETHTQTVAMTYRRPSSSSSSKPSYSVTTPGTTENGSVTVSPKNATKGSTVTVTVKPDDGYQLDKLTVTDAKGGTISVTDKGNGKYTFTMPASKVTITPTFVKIAEQPTEKTFVDVAKSDWFADAVAYVTQKGLMNGTGSDTFSPNASTTRGMLMTVLARYAGEDTTGGATWYEKGMNWAKAKGVSDGTNPEVNITREQLVTMLYRYAGSPAASGSLDNFSDAASVSSYAVNAMQWAVANGIVNGSNGKLNPQNNATRAEVAAILMRFCEMSK